MMCLPRLRDDHQEILADFPCLTEEDILACLSYAADRERQQLVVTG